MDDRPACVQIKPQKPATAFGAVVCLMYFLTMGFLAFNTRILNPPASSTTHALMWGLILVFIIGAVVSTVAVWKVVSDTDLDQGILPVLGSSRPIRLYEFTFLPAVIATLAMLAMFIASIVWFWQAFSARLEMLAQNMGPMMTNTRDVLIITLTLMTIAIGVAITGIARGYSARKAAWVLN